MNSSKINILLSTYNGEKYLIDQLDSIFQQTHQNFTLYIRDDGSTDSTLALLDAYTKNHPDYADQIRLLANPERKNLGYMDSFWTLLDKCEPADYYAFCDQDDIWLPNKLEAGLNHLQVEKANCPLLYFSNFYHCNEDLSVKRPLSVSYQSLSLQDVIFYTPAFGFSIIINHNLRQLALQTQNHHELPHDGWLQKLAAAFGKIIHDPTCTAYYRRHEKAVTSQNKSILSLILNWITNDILGESMKKTHYILNQFFQEYNSFLDCKDAEMLELFATNEKSFTIWRQRITYPGKLRPSFSGRLALRLCFLLNTY